uniref:Uncharacterized protein n=1 Tax=Ditylenchus dipsaci TaxID=166011 RepID=A0A915CTE7_9BILA
MARLKQAADPEKEAEIRRLLEQFKQGFVGDLAELERAKRKFSSTFVEAIITQFESLVPECVLSMKAVDFLAEMNKDEDEGSDIVRTTITKFLQQQSESEMSPATRKIVHQLTSVLLSKAKKEESQV